MSRVCRIGDKHVFLCRKDQSRPLLFLCTTCSRTQCVVFFRHQASLISIISRYKMTRVSSCSSSEGKMENPTARPIGIRLCISISIPKGKKIIDMLRRKVIYTYHDTDRLPKVPFFSMGGSSFSHFSVSFLAFCHGNLCPCMYCLP